MDAEKHCRTLAATQDNLLSRAQAIACGLAPRSIVRRTNTGEWARVMPSVYLLDRAEPTWGRKVRAASLWAGEGSALSHQTAAALWKLDGYGPGRVAVTTKRSLKPPTGVTVHRVRELAAAEVTDLDGMCVTTPPRTLMDLAAIEPRERVEDALDDVLRRGLVSVAKLRWFLHTYGGRGRKGTATLRALVEARPAGTVVDSPLERRVWDLLVRCGAPLPVRQHHVYDGSRLIARLDFAYPDERVAVEADGYRWHSGRRAWSHDLARRNALTARGWSILHVTHDDVTRRPDEVGQRLRDLLRIRTLSLEVRSEHLQGQSCGSG